MAVKKYYAVKKGRKTGIFKTWGECKAQVDGYSDASYKAFTTLKDAENFLYNNGNNNVLPLNLELEPQKSLTLNTVSAYIDGSFSDEINKYSYGCVIIAESIIELSGAGDNAEALGMRNVAGELLGAMAAIKWAVKNNYNCIILYHDYEGIAKWANGEWKAKHESTKKYVNFIKKYSSSLKIEFVKVLAHSGVKYNEQADKLAKKALHVDSEKETTKVPVSESKANINEFRLFDKLMKGKDKTKNKFTFKFKEYDVSEHKLQKFIKELWKLHGKDEKFIDSMIISVNPYTNIIEWIITDKSNNKEIFKMNL